MAVSVPVILFRTPHRLIGIALLSRAMRQSSDIRARDAPGCRLLRPRTVLIFRNKTLWVISGGISQLLSKQFMIKVFHILIL